MPQPPGLAYSRQRMATGCESQPGVSLMTFSPASEDHMPAKSLTAALSLTQIQDEAGLWSGNKLPDI